MGGYKFREKIFLIRKALAWKFLTKAGWPIVFLSSLYRRTFARHKRTFVVMGSFGKTTTARAVRAVLGLPPSLWTELNANHMGEIGWAFLKEHPWYSHAVVEIGASLPGRLSRYVRALHPNAIIMTSLGREHLLTFKTIEALRREKTEGLKMLPSGGTAILNGDDQQVR